jgi:protein SCO1
MLRSVVSGSRRGGLFSIRVGAIVASLLLAAVGVGVYLTPSATRGVLIGGPFSLQTADGKTVTDANMAGHPFLVYFGYTHCPDVCPTTLAQLSDVLRQLPDKPIRVLFVTVDPERDTPKIMSDYVSSFDPRIICLSGTPEAVAEMEKGYRVYARKAPGKGGDYAMDHSSIVYLMEAGGKFVEAFNLDRAPQESAKELSSYL